MSHLKHSRRLTLFLPLILLALLVLAIVAGGGFIREHASQDGHDRAGESPREIPGEMPGPPTAPAQSPERLTHAAAPPSGRQFAHGPAGAATPPASPGSPEILRELMERRLVDEGAAITTHPDGRRSLHLGNRFLHMSAVVTDEHGRQRIRCYTSADQLQDDLATTPAPSDAPPPAQPPAVDQPVDH